VIKTDVNLSFLVRFSPILLVISNSNSNFVLCFIGEEGNMMSVLLSVRDYVILSVITLVWYLQNGWS